MQTLFIYKTILITEGRKHDTGMLGESGLMRDLERFAYTWTEHYILYFVFYDYSRQLLNSLDQLNITVLYRIHFYMPSAWIRSMSTNSRSIAAEALEKRYLKYERSSSAWLIKWQFNPEYFLHNLLALIHCTGCIKKKATTYYSWIFTLF